LGGPLLIIVAQGNEMAPRFNDCISDDGLTLLCPVSGKEKMGQGWVALIDVYLYKQTYQRIMKFSV